VRTRRKFVKILSALETFLVEARAKRNAKLDSLMAEAENRLGEVFKEQGQEFVTGLAGSVGNVEKAAAKAEAATSSAMAKALTDLVSGCLEVSVVAQAAEIGISLSWVLKNPLAVAYIKEHGADLVAGINQTTKDYIRKVIADGVANGDSYDKIAKAITDRYASMAAGRPQAHIDSRAHGIVVTEAGNAFEEGNAIVAKELQDAGLTMEKFWQSVDDDLVCSAECEANQAQGWIPFDEDFQSGHPHPLAHPYCRCTALYRRKAKEGV
jgi:hypothetical protein